MKKRGQLEIGGLVILVVVSLLTFLGFNLIVITKAEHLDSNRNSLSDIYEEVRELDNIWSEEIPDGDYVRVTFEVNLTFRNDITLYPRIVSGNPRIEVYEAEKDELIAEFTSLNSNQYNKIFLTNLQGRQDVFDLRIVGGRLEFDHIIDPDIGVVSVENFGLSMAAGVATANAPFTKGQNKSNSVPFVTRAVFGSGANEDWQHHLTEVTLNSTGVILTRASTDGALEYNISVVEFDASSVKVQNGSLCAPTTIGCNTPIGVSVNTSRVAMVFYSQISGTIDDDYNDGSIRGDIINSTHLIFSRVDAIGTITGTWYIFESLDGSFTVQNVDLTVPNGAEIAHVIIDSVATDKTFLIASYQTTENSDNARDGSTRVELTNSTYITAFREGSAANDNINLVVYAITFSGNENVQRGTLSFTDKATAPESIRNDSLNTIDLNAAMPWNPVLSGRMSSDGTGEGDLQSAFNRLEFVNSTSIRGTRGRTGGDTTASYEVIEWIVGDTTKPTFIKNQTNTTIAGDTANFSLFVNDDTALNPNGQYIFSINQSGAYVNDSAVNFTTTGEWANVTKVLNSTVGVVIGYVWYIEDNVQNTNHTIAHHGEPFKLTTTSAVTTCDCPAFNTDWRIDDGSQCLLSTVCNIGTGNLLIYSGRLHITSSGSLNANACFIQDDQSLYVDDGGGLICRA